MFLVISGISGSGKSTIGLQLAKSLNLTYVDLDSFYLPQKPYVTLSINAKVKNWDTLEALDIEAIKLTIREKAPNGLLSVGFTLRDDLFNEFKPYCHIHLSTGQTKDQIIERCIASRQQSKTFSTSSALLLNNNALLLSNSALVDKYTVEEVIYPFYVETVTKSTINHIVEVFDHNGQRRKINDIMTEITQML